MREDQDNEKKKNAIDMQAKGKQENVRSGMRKEKKMQVKGKKDSEGENNEWTLKTKNKKPQHQKMCEDGH